MNPVRATASRTLSVGHLSLPMAHPHQEPGYGRAPMRGMSNSIQIHTLLPDRGDRRVDLGALTCSDLYAASMGEDHGLSAGSVRNFTPGAASGSFPGHGLGLILD